MGSTVQNKKTARRKMSEKPEVDNENFATSFTMFCTTIIVINVSMIICGAMVFIAVKVKYLSGSLVIYKVCGVRH